MHTYKSGRINKKNLPTLESILVNFSKVAKRIFLTFDHGNINIYSLMQLRSHEVRLGYSIKYNWQLKAKIIL